MNFNLNPSLGTGFKLTTTPATSTTSTSAPTTGSNTGNFNISGLGGATQTQTSGLATIGSTTTPASNLGSLTSSLTTTTAPAASSQLTTTQNPPITFKVLEDYINKWMSDLDSQEKDFINQATQLNALDKLMIENGEKIIDINNEVTRLNNDQDQLEQELNFVHSQQNDLEQAIKKLETGIEHMPLIPQQTCDTSRIEMYKLLIEVDNQLKSMSIDLRDIIKRLNDTNVNLNDPIVQISKILNAHMDSLNWIEENTGLIQNQVEKISKVVDDRLKESDRTRDDSFSRYSYFK